MLLKTASSFNDYKTVSKYNHEKFKTKGDFLSHILTNLDRGQKSHFNVQNHHHLKGMSSDNKGSPILP